MRGILWNRYKMRLAAHAGVVGKASLVQDHCLVLMRTCLGVNDPRLSRLAHVAAAKTFLI